MAILRHADRIEDYPSSRANRKTYVRTEFYQFDPKRSSATRSSIALSSTMGAGWALRCVTSVAPKAEWTNTTLSYPLSTN